ncbi:DNAJ heat shock N-terminal domain-containing protein [Obelidium mucronatum]|nr:DNAJ heat shock N-terminal domain-containing protein [Obelidium mucronatum]
MSQSDRITHYEALGIPADSSNEDIKRQYQKLVLQLHPDKAGANTHSPSAAPLHRFSRELHLQLVLKAWEVLRDPETKAIYDRELASNGGRGSSAQNGIMNAQVDLDDMEYNEDASSFSSSCRCGGEYVITEAELETGIEIVPCSTCSLCITVLYSVCQDGE